MNRTNLILVVMLAGCLGYIIGQAAKSEVCAQDATAMGSGGIAVAAAQYGNLQRPFVWVIDARNRTMAIYDYNGSQLQLKAARLIKYDLSIEEFPARGQSPTVEQMKKAVKKSPRK